jgi:protein-S-isoprenylcysteine O-methyltransferase Ste14
MRPLPFTDSAAAISFGIAVGIFLAVQLRIAVVSGLRVIAARRRRGTHRLDRGTLPLVNLLTAGGIAAAIVLAIDVKRTTVASGLPVLRGAVLVLGLTCVVVGALGRQWAITTLGRSFTLAVRVTDGQRVVTEGPYRWVRHPSYTADILVFLGIGLAMGNWLSILATALLPTVGLLYRIRVEEAALLGYLGEPYATYAAGRKRLVPGLW